jgi:deoxyribonuclease V
MPTDVSAQTEQWKTIQHEMRERMVVSPLPRPLPRFVAGADCAFSPDRGMIFASALVYDREERRLVELTHVIQPVEIPYVPGFLSFREGPAVIAALLQLKHPFGVIMIDGHGYAHPRRCGIAAHVAITLDKPGIGAAKSILVGTHAELPPNAGARVPLMSRGEQIGTVLRTKDQTRPVYVSIAHRSDLDSGVELVLACCTKYRLPEPTRLADMEVAKLKQRYLANESLETSQPQMDLL